MYSGVMTSKEEAKKPVETMCECVEITVEVLQECRDCIVNDKLPKSPGAILLFKKLGIEELIDQEITKDKQTVKQEE